MLGKKFANSLFLLIALLTLFASVAHADEKTIAQKSSAIFDEVMSPYCPAVTLSACTSPNARALRDQIRDWVEEGHGEEKIKEMLIESFGVTILGAPEAKGFGVIGWLAPGIGVLIGGGMIFIVLFAVGKKEEAEIEPHKKPSDDFESELDEEIAKRLI